MWNVIAILFVLLAGVVLLINALGAGGGVGSDSKAQTAINEWNQIRVTVDTLFAAQPWPNQDITSMFINTPSLAPAGMVQSGALLDPWGGAVDVYVQPAGTDPAGNAIWISFANVPVSACIAMITAIAPQLAGSGQGAIGANGNASTPTGAATVCSPGPDTVQGYFQ